MKYFILMLLVVACSSSDDKPKPELSYDAKSEHVTIVGKSKTDASTAKAAGALNQMVIDSVEGKGRN